MKLYLYSHLPPDYTYECLQIWFKMQNPNIKVIDIFNIDFNKIKIEEDDKFFLFEPQNPGHLNILIRSLRLFNIKNTHLYFFENVFDSKSRHIWKKMLIEYVGHIYSCNYRLADNKKFFWVPAPTYLMNYKMININYFRAFIGGRQHLYQGEKFDIINNKTEDNFLDNINYIENYDKKKKYMAAQPIGGDVDDYRIDILKEYDSLCDIDCYGGHPKLKNFKNYKGWIFNKEENTMSALYSKRIMRDITSIECMTNYKFVIVLENEVIDGYFSERFIDGLATHSIMIYYGPKNPKKFFPEVFKYVINGYDYDDTIEVLNYINKMSKNEYELRINGIKSLLKKITKVFSMDNIMHFITNKIFEKEGKNKEECILLNNLNKIKELD